MKVVGLCGGIGAGKSTVAALLAQQGAVVIDVDALGRFVLTDDEVLTAVIAEFGRAVLDDVGAIDRSALANEVFADENRLANLEAISHPAINRAIGRRLDELTARDQPGLVVLDMAVLVETDLGRLEDGRGYSEILVVEADTDVRLHRLIDRGMTRAEALARMASQASDSERRTVADYVLVNNGDAKSLAAAVKALYPRLLDSGNRPPTA